MATLLDLIDLKETKSCKVKINGKEVELVHLRKEQGKYLAMVAGGRLIEVDKSTFDDLDAKLEYHLKTHILCKK
jgi:hypothetical protein